jgi:dihydroorotate dehydrogenase electron transfer subunit
LTARWDLLATIRRNAAVSAGLLQLDLALPRAVAFAPGQFAMLNLVGPAEMVLRRPFSILASADDEMSFLYRVAGRGTALLAAAREGDRVACLAPLGTPFPAPQSGLPVILLAGGVGVPPLHAWWERYRRPGDLAFFGGRDGGDVPWSLLDGWRVSVDAANGVPAGREAFAGLVTALCTQDLARAGMAGPYQVLACGPHAAAARGGARWRRARLAAAWSRSRSTWAAATACARGAWCRCGPGGSACATRCCRRAPCSTPPDWPGIASAPATGTGEGCA